MDAGHDRPELARSYEGLSLSDFDRGFCTDRSLSLSAVSADGFLRPNKGVVLEYSEPDSAPAPCLNYSTSLLSPLVVLQKQALSLSTALISPVQGQSSTPYERVMFQKTVLDVSCVDLTTTHPSWEVCLVKALVESPKSCLESTWCPINLSAQSLMWSGTSPHPNDSEELQRSWKERDLVSLLQSQISERNGAHLTWPFDQNPILGFLLRFLLEPYR